MRYFSSLLEMRFLWIRSWSSCHVLYFWEIGCGVCGPVIRVCSSFLVISICLSCLFFVSRVFWSLVLTDVRFTYGEFDGVCHDLFSRKAFVVLGYGVVFVAHRKISFVSCMVGLPIVCSIWCVVWFFTFLGSRAVFIRCVLFEWIGVGVVLSPLHVKIGPGRTDGKDCVVNVLGIFIATVAMLVFKGLFRAGSIFYIYLVFEKQIQIFIGIA